MPRIPHALFGLLLLSGALHAQDIQRFEQHYEGVLGTTLDLTLYGPDATPMEGAAEAALAEIARLDAIFSSYRDDSEVMRLNRERSITGASSELMEVLDMCGRWERITQKRFSCKLGRIIAAWNDAEKTQTLPDRAAMQALATATLDAEPVLDRSARGITLPEPVELELSGIATGYIVDRTLAVLREKLRSATAIKVDIGGDSIYWGRPPLSDGWRVGIANPMVASDGEVLDTLSLSGLAITESGHANRFRTIAGQQFSHIFVPATGWPVENGIGTVTMAPTAVAADAAATAMTLQNVTDAASWASAQPELDGLAIDAAGNRAISDQWVAYVAEEVVDETNSVLALNYTLPSFQSVGSYSRPYVAVWVTDTKQNLLKSLLLLGEDQRWARENSRWWRRVGREMPDLLDGTARPTRAPGEYRLTWDGLDAEGEPLPPGNYLLHVEAARQNGGHNYQSLPFTLGTAQTLELPGDGELGSLLLQIK